MKQYLACFMNEWEKLIRRKKYWVLLLLGVAVCMGTTLIKIAIEALTHGVVKLTGISSSMALAELMIHLWVPLVSMMAVCDLFVTEFQDLTMKATLLRPVHRFKIYTAKISAVALLALVYLAGLVLASSGLDALLTGTLQGFGYAFGAYLLDFIPMLVLILMATFLNQWQKGSTMTMFLCIMVYIVLYVAGILVPNLSGLLFTGYMTWHNIWLGQMLPVSAMISKMALLLGYGMVFFSGGYLLFLKREV